MPEDRTIVFTITEEYTGYWIRTKTKLGFALNYQGTEFFRNVNSCLLFHTLEHISEELNKRGYAVVFEVD